MIHNHYSAKLSELDLEMIRHIPPGGNWKNIPKNIPSKRLQNIRRSYKNGKGSRSTYYGRLKGNKPSYTINTYFNRPGNGCFIHYDKQQSRLISQREAARLQGFPDNFRFLGSKSQINKQIGNAVPPVLAHQIAIHLEKKPGVFVDLFCGAGGLSLGFKWAGWKPLVANDIEPNFTETYSENMHHDIVCGDIRSSEVSEKIIKKTREKLKENKNSPFYILGGPPCQGFSTAGKRRSLQDERNYLFKNYKDIVEALKPDGFVFENVMGLTNMEKGKVFNEIKKTLESITKNLSVWKLSAEEHGVPQKRKRLFLVGKRTVKSPMSPPKKICYSSKSHNNHLFDKLSPPISVKEALSDLPPLKNGEDGSYKNYIYPPQNSYQQLMRRIIDVEEFLTTLR